MAIDSSKPNPTETSGEILVKTFAVGPLQCNCTIIGDLQSKQSIVVDPGGDADVILAFLAEHDLTPVRVLHTHAHFDHFLASGIIREQTGAPLALHTEDRFLWDRLEQQCLMFGTDYTPVPPPDETIEHQQTFDLPNCQCQALHTPGHTPGSTSFYFPNQKLLLAGDTLFRQSIGRTDLPGGDMATIQASIRTRLLTLDEDAKVITGHGASTTIGHEIKNNPFVGHQARWN